MFTLDKDFLEGLGLEDMPEAEMQAFLEHLQEELEVRVGEKMSEGMSEAQIEEFEKVIDGDAVTIEAVLLEAEDYRNTEDYKKLMAASGFADDSLELKEEYASLVWLKKNCPQYAEIVQNVIVELKEEIKAGKDKLISDSH
jgi:hypothetical protein